MDDDGEAGRDAAAKVARAFAAQGRTAAWLRAQPSGERERPFWGEVAAELDAIEARRRLRVATPPGQDS